MIGFLMVALGGAIGAVLRYGVGLIAPFPFGTLAVNVIGSFFIGMLIISTQDKAMQLLLVTGVLGGFTTFSTFSLEVMYLWQQGQFIHSLAYVVASVLLSVVAVAGGYMIGKML